MKYFGSNIGFPYPGLLRLENNLYFRLLEKILKNQEMKYRFHNGTFYEN